MIFVTVGTNEAPFDRLLRGVETLAADERVIVQYGASDVRPCNAECVDFLSFEAMVDHIRRARAIVTHAGVGSILLAATNRRRPVVIPRLRRFGEAVDDHQVPLAIRLAESGMVRLLYEPSLLGEALASNVEEDFFTDPKLTTGTRLGTELRTLIGSIIAESSLSA